MWALLCLLPALILPRGVLSSSAALRLDLGLVILQQQPGWALRITFHWPLDVAGLVTKSLEGKINSQLIKLYPRFYFWKGELSFAADSLLLWSAYVTHKLGHQWWGKCQRAFYFFLFSWNAPRAAAYQGLCPQSLITALSTESPSPVLLLGWKLGLSWKSLPGQTWGSPSLLSLFGSAALQPAQNIQAKWGQKICFFKPKCSEGKCLKRTDLVWCDLGCFFSGSILLWMQQLHCALVHFEHHKECCYARMVRNYTQL